MRFPSSLNVASFKTVSEKVIKGSDKVQTKRLSNTCVPVLNVAIKTNLSIHIQGKTTFL